MDGDVGAVVISSMWLLEGPDGYWTGPWTGRGDDQNRCHGAVVLTGHGAYEGFCAVLTEQPQQDAKGAVGPAFEGAILAGVVPPIPEPLEPTTD